jgi:hypothetical protein
MKCVHLSSFTNRQHLLQPGRQCRPVAKVVNLPLYIADVLHFAAPFDTAVGHLFLPDPHHEKVRTGCPRRFSHYLSPKNNYQYSLFTFHLYPFSCSGRSPDRAGPVARSGDRPQRGGMNGYFHFSLLTSHFSLFTDYFYVTRSSVVQALQATLPGLSCVTQAAGCQPATTKSVKLSEVNDGRR